MPVLIGILIERGHDHPGPEFERGAGLIDASRSVRKA